MFGKIRKEAAKSILDSSEYTNTIKPKNGNVHIMLVDSFSGTGEGSVLQIEEKYSNQVNEILDKLQSNGYEIVDVKVNSIPVKTLIADMKYQTAILYK